MIWQRSDLILRPLALAVMAGCVALALGWVIQVLFPAWSLTPLVIASVLAVLDAEYARLLGKRPMAMTDRWRFHAVEIAVYVLVFQGVVYLFNPGQDLLADLGIWLRNPFILFANPTLWLCLLVALVFWLQASDTLDDLELINEPATRDTRPVTPHENLIQRFFMGGAALLVLTAIVQLAEDNGWRPGPGSALLLNVLIYFILGLALLGLLRLFVLRRNWQAQGMSWPTELVARWGRFTAIFLILIVSVAILLPTRYGLGLLVLVGSLLLLVSWALAQALFLPVLLISILIAWVMRALFPDARPAPLPFEMPRALPPPDLEAATTNSAWLELLRSAALWIVLLLMAIYIGVSYLRDHPALLESLQSLGVFRLLRDWLRSLRGRMGDLAQAIAQRLPKRVSLAAGRLPAVGRFFRLGAASSREQIRYYYLSLLRRTQAAGFSRRPHETPAEYQATLDHHLPAAQPETSTLTQAFVEARYSPREIDPGYAARVRETWRRLRAMLQPQRRQ